jgi:hypothetical protein
VSACPYKAQFHRDVSSTQAVDSGFLNLSFVFSPFSRFLDLISPYSGLFSIRFRSFFGLIKSRNMALDILRTFVHNIIWYLKGILEVPLAIHFFYYNISSIYLYWSTTCRALGLSFQETTLLPEGLFTRGNSRIIQGRFRNHPAGFAP